MLLSNNFVAFMMMSQAFCCPIAWMKKALRSKLVTVREDRSHARDVIR